MLPNQNSNSYSTQGWLSQIYSLLEGSVGLGLVNGIIINGTAFFVQDTKPTTRIDGSALVAGDKWYKTDDGTEWFWNGTYWLGDEILSNIGQGVNTTSNVNTPGIAPTIKYNLFVQSVHWSGKVGASNDGSNYRFLRLYSYNNAGANVIIISQIATTSTYTAGTYFALDVPVNYLFTTDTSVTNSVSPTYQMVFVQEAQSGSPGAVRSSLSVLYRYAVK